MTNAELKKLNEQARLNRERIEKRRLFILTLTTGLTLLGFVFLLGLIIASLLK